MVLDLRIIAISLFCLLSINNIGLAQNEVDTLLANQLYREALSIKPYWNYKTANELLQKAALIYKFHDSQKPYLQCQNKIAHNLRKMWDLTKAHELAENNAEQSILYFGKDHEIEMEAYSIIGKVYFDRREYSQAISYLEQSIDIAKDKLKNKPLELSSIMLALGESHFEAKNHSEAFNFFRKAEAIQIQTLGKNAPDLKYTYLAYAFSYFTKSNLDSSLIYFNKTIDLLEQSGNSDHVILVKTWKGLAPLNDRLGDHIKANDNIQKAFAILEKNKLPEFPDLVSLNIEAAWIDLQLGRNKEVILKMESTESILNNLPEQEFSNTFQVFNLLATTYNVTGDYQKSKAYFLKCMELCKKEKDIRYLAMTLNNFSRLLFKLKDYDTALKYAKRALGLNLESVFGENHPAIMNLHDMTAQIYHGRREYQLALDHYNKAIQVAEALPEKKVHPRIGKVYRNMAQTYYNINNRPESLNYLHKALNLFNSISEHQGINANLYNMIASNYFQDKDYQSALIHTRKAKINCLSNLTDSLLFDQGKQTLELRNFREYYRALRWETRIAMRQYELSGDQSYLKQAHQLLPILNELIELDYRQHINTKDKLGYNAKALEFYKTALECNRKLYQATENPTYINQAFYYSEKCKANVLSRTISESSALKRSNIPDSLLQKEKNLKENIALYESKIQQFKKDDDTSNLLHYRNKLLFNANREMESLIEQLESKYPDYYEIKYTHEPVELSAIQQQLNDKTIVIEYVIDYQTYKQSYERKSQLQIFTIQADEIKLTTGSWSETDEEAIIELYRLLQKSTLVKNKNKSKYIKLAYQLYQKLITPINDQLAGIERIVFIGEGKMHYLPFEVLLKDELETDFSKLNYLIRDYAISYHYSASLFERSYQTKRTKPSNNLLAFAPVFLKSSKGNTIPSNNRAYADTTYQAVRGGVLQPLPWTEYEVKGIQNLFETKGIKNNILLTQEEANEANLKTYAEQGYKYVHIASHSFSNISNPELSGIACHTNQDQTNVSHEDGILYAAEVYNLHLDADLVVLSSCESGIGKLITGEGMLGLNRGVVYAGATNILFSLWKANDKKSSELMIDFYSNVLSGKTYPEALRASKLKMLKNETTALPVYWSTFVLIGR